MPSKKYNITTDKIEELIELRVVNGAEGEPQNFCIHYVYIAQLCVECQSIVEASAKLNDVCNEYRRQFAQAVEQYTELKNTAVRHKRLLYRVLRHYILRDRWPCSECGRTGLKQPLRINQTRTEDGKEFLQGCSRCNADELLTDIEETLKC